MTKKEAMELTIELWTWLAETGGGKEDWPGWERFGGLDEYGECEQVHGECFLCEHGYQQEEDMCNACPYAQEFGRCHRCGEPFDKWAMARTEKTRKEYASLFLEQMKTLR